MQAAREMTNSVVNAWVKEIASLRQNTPRGGGPIETQFLGHSEDVANFALSAVR